MKQFLYITFSLILFSFTLLCCKAITNSVNTLASSGTQVEISGELIQSNKVSSFKEEDENISIYLANGDVISTDNKHVIINETDEDIAFVDVFESVIKSKKEYFYKLYIPVTSSQ